MNRRDALQAGLAAAFVPVAAAETDDDARLEILRAFSRLSREDLLEFSCMAVAMTPQHWLRPMAVRMLDEGRSFEEIAAALDAGVRQNERGHGRMEGLADRMRRERHD